MPTNTTVTPAHYFAAAALGGTSPRSSPSAKRIKKFLDCHEPALGALGIPKLVGEGSGSKLVEQTEGAMKLIRKRMIRFQIFLKLNDGGTDDNNSPRCAHRRGCLTVALPSFRP